MTFRLTAEIEGMAALRRNLGRFSDDAVRHLEAALDEAGEAVRDSAVRAILHGEKTGRVYTHYLEEKNGRLVAVRKRAVPHQASAPGEAPASDTGNLVANIVVDNTNPRDLEVAVASLAPYSGELEYGRGGKFPMEPRPFMRPALLENEDHVVDLARQGLRRAAQGARDGT